MAEQRYQAVLAVISDGETVTERGGQVRGASQDGAWVAGQVRGRGPGGSGGSVAPAAVVSSTRSGRSVEALVATMRSVHPGWGPRRVVYELGRAAVEQVPSESAVYRALVRLNLIDPTARRRRPTVTTSVTDQPN